MGPFSQRQRRLETTRWLNQGQDLPSHLPVLASAVSDSTTPHPEPAAHKRWGTRPEPAHGSRSHPQGPLTRDSSSRSRCSPAPLKTARLQILVPEEVSTRGRHRIATGGTLQLTLRSSRGKVKVPFHSTLINGYRASNSTNFIRVQSDNSF